MSYINDKTFQARVTAAHLSRDLLLASPGERDGAELVKQAEIIEQLLLKGDNN